MNARLTGLPNSIRALPSLVLTLLMVFALTSPATANATPGATCVADTVVDETDGHVLDISKVRDAVTEVAQDTGADVFVRAFQNMPTGSGASWWRDAYTNCPAWLGADGKTPKPNILVVAFGMDHTSAIQYGSNFHKLDSSVDNIRSKKLGSGLRDGRYTDAVTDTLYALRDANNPMDLSGLWAAFKWIAIVVVAALTLFGAFVASRRAVREILASHRALAKTRAEYQETRNEASNAVLGGELTALQIRLDSALSSSDPTPIKVSLRKYKNEIDQFSSEFHDQISSVSLTSRAKMAAATQVYKSVSRGIGKALQGAEGTVSSAEAFAKTCTIDAKREDLTVARDRADAELRALNDTRWAWADLSTSRDEMTTSRGSVDALLALVTKGVPPTRPAINTILSANQGTADRSEAARQAALVSASRLDDALDDIRRQVVRFSSAVDDVSEPTRRAAQQKVAQVLTLGQTVSSWLEDSVRSGTPVPVSELNQRTDSVIEALAEAIRDAKNQIHQANAKREAERAAKERAEREKREAKEREEAEERRRRYRATDSYYGRSSSDSASSFGLGYGVGWGAGHSSGGSSSSDFGGGGFSGGGDFGGGSSGGW